MDPCQQAPFEVGDQVSWQGTLVHGANAGDPDYISAHTIEANVGIYTYSGHQPSYVAIGEFGVGSADPSATAVTGIARRRRTACSSSPRSPTEDPRRHLHAGRQGGRIIKNRWVTPFEMTGENQTGVPSGGITTAGMAHSPSATGSGPPRPRRAC